MVPLPKVTFIPLPFITRLLYVAYAAGSVMLDCISMVPAPGVKVKLVDVNVPPIIKVPPLVILRLLDETKEITLLTFNLFVPPEAQLTVPADEFPMINDPYATLSVAELLSTVHVPLILRLSPATGRVFPSHLVASLKFPGPVNVFAKTPVHMLAK